MKLLIPFVYAYYVVRGIVTSPIYAWRRTCSYLRNSRNENKRGGYLPAPRFTDEHGKPVEDQPHKRRRRGHRGGRKHKKHHN